ncbi:MAG TPA: hypothetical protein VH116_01835 [Gemmatimonadales bacterium]|jgi:hypothetical protein|nr:hypothetical protein [Gemmatimonadales bacterium]
MKPYVVTTGTVFALFALLHLWRFVAEWPHLSIAAAGIGVVAAGLSVWAWRLLRLSPGA